MRGDMGGENAGLANLRFVESSMDTPPSNPISNVQEGWLLGSETFFKKIPKLLSKPHYIDQTPRARRLTSLDANLLNTTVASYFKATPASYQSNRFTAPGRDMAAHLLIDARHRRFGSLQLYLDYRNLSQ